MVKAIVIVLTSNKLKLLHRCVKSVDDQFEVDFEYDKIIDVNTVNDEYYEQVKDYYKNNKEWEVIRTESNNRPGMGHNSQYKIFKERIEYDYLIPIDGDDLFYRCAFQQLEKSLIEDPDILHLMLNDYISIVEKPTLRSVRLKGKFKLYGSFNEEKNWWKSIPVKNPYTNSLEKCKTPTRIVLASRNIFNTTVPIRYSEDMKLYDDYICFLGIYEASLREELNIFALSNSYIYHYNATNDDSVSVKFNDPAYENKVFKRESVQFEYASKKWDLANLKFLSLGIPEKFTIRDKINLGYQVINDVMAEKWKTVNKLLSDKDYEKLTPQLKFLSQTGIDDTYFINLNLGVCFYKKKKYGIALYYLEKASFLRPSFEVFNYLFKISTEVGTIIKARYYCECLANLKDGENFIKVKMNMDKVLKYKYKKIGKFTIKQTSIVNNSNKKNSCILYWVFWRI